MGTWYIENKPEAELLQHMQRFPELSLHVAAKKGSALLARSLLELGALVDDKERLQCTPLHFAAATGHLDVVKVLVERGRANVNLFATDGSTPLHYAALYGFANIVDYLLRHGADPYAVTQLKSTAAHYACSSGHVHVVRSLIAHADGNGRRLLSYRDARAAVPFSALPLAEESAIVARERLITSSGSGLSRDFSVLRQSGDLCDIEILCKDFSSLKAHRLVLHARAPELVSLAAPGSPGKIDLTSSVAQETCETFLQWLYSNEISQQDMRWDSFRSLIEFALRFSLKKLLAWLEVVMERNLDPVSLSHIATFLVPHAATFPNLTKSIARFLVAKSHLFFTDDRRPFSLSLAAWDMVLSNLPLKAFPEPLVAPPLNEFPPGYEPPNWLEDAARNHVPAPMPSAQPGFTDAEKERLLQALGNLSDNEQCMDEISRVVSDPRYASQSGPEVEIDLNSLPREALLELQKIVQRYMR